ncbi:LytTR family DNA-binding domain-containing protein [Gymnodinialimonas sp. 2305UL16-5]|uniref:LytTR family DNA-binding domain-containing protein n=1 Tax=Gymnodinialimonas mytili TaxID=3126503 RepID=UPI00309A3134
MTWLPIYQELTDLARNWRLWLILAVVATMAGLAGPFDTYQDMSLPNRIIYWWLLVGVTFATGAAFGSVAERLIARICSKTFIVLGAGALLSAIPTTLVVVLINAIFGSTYGPADLVLLYAYVAAVMCGVCAITMLSRDWFSAAVPVASDDAKTPPIMSRLHGANRGALLRMSAQDHYVEVVTNRGSELLLMKLRDAVTEAAPTHGAQVHRSHWVATEAVSRSERIKGRVFLRLTDGCRVPVGRRYLKSARDAGLIASK